MRYLKYLALLAIFLFAAGYSQAQVSVGIGIGVGPVYSEPVYVAPPLCPYGYYDYYPYGCAPYGYYGPAYFVRGEFIGVGPWYRGHFDRDRYWGDRDRFEHEGHWGDRDRDHFDRGRDYRSFDRGRGDWRGDNHFDRRRGGDGFNWRGDNHFDRGYRDNHFDRGRGGDGFHGHGNNHFDRGNGNRGGGRHHE